MRALRVVDPGPSLLVQDLGRPGYAHLGVPHSGALDPASLALANRLVGNPCDAAGLEVLLGGCVLRAEESMRLAVTGARVPVTVAGRPEPWGQALSVPAGSQVEIGRAQTGLRSWVALAGGVVVSPVLGSRATDTLTGLGPAPLAAADQVPIGEPPPAAPHVEVVDAGAGDGSLRMRFGPRQDWFTAQSRTTLTQAEYVVSAASDRVAVRLEGPALTRRIDRELPSEGLVAGAVQVPANGQPLIFLADHPVTGGYPVMAVLAAADLGRCAQLRPGDVVGFVGVA